MEFVGKVLLEVRIQAKDSMTAKKKLEYSMKGNLYGVRKQVLIEPDWDEEYSKED